MAKAPSQLIEQVTRHSAMVEGVKTRYANELRILLGDIEDALLGRLARSDITKWSRARAEKQLAGFQAMIQERYDDQLLPALNRQIRELAIYEAGFEQRSLSNVAPRHNFLLPTENQIMSAVMTRPLSVKGASGGKLLESYIKDWTSDQTGRFTDTIRLGFAQGETTPQIISRLNAEALPINRRGLEGMTRTALQHCATQARMATFEANKDIVKGYIIVVTLDLRTSEVCRFEGEKREVYQFGKGPVPPLHEGGCRSSISGAIDERFDFLDKGATQRARDPETGKVGYVPAQMGYYDWLKRQDREFVEAVVGPTRAKLLLDGKISSQRFAELGMNKQFKPRTLRQMEKLDPLVFKAAGVELPG